MPKFNNEFTDMERVEYVRHWTSVFGTLAYQRRQALNLQIQDVAIFSGLNRDTVSKIESGSHPGTPMHVALSLCWGLEQQPAELFGFLNKRPRISTMEFEAVMALRKIYGAT